MNARWALRLGVGVVLLCALAIANAGCAGGGERSLGQVQQQLEGGGGLSGGEGDSQGAEGEEAGDGTEGDEASGNDIGIVSLACPTGPVPVKLAIAHEYNYSPNRQTDVYSVNASTDPNAWCMITIAGSKVSAEPCNFSYHYEGFVHGDGNDVCQIAGDGKAALEIEGRCQGGIVTLTLSEHGDDDGLTGKLSCPGVATIEYGIPYPQSRTEARFPISSDGTTVTDSAERDVSGQFSYKKTWTLIVPPDVISGP
jgi:hypothetical protein